MDGVRQETESISGAERAKMQGVFYTDAQIADFLVWWAIRSALDTVMDPSFGGGVFLRSVCNRLLELGGQPAHQIHGVELDAEVHAQIAEKLSEEFGIKKRNLLRGSFFDIDRTAVPPVDVIVGNPPFIRYQRFSGDIRKQALMRAAQQGVCLTELSSSWAPFLVHSIAMLKQGGRLAMVVPMEIAHAAYAQPILKHLSESFGRVTFLTFQRKLFPDLSEDTLLLLAEDKGTRSAKFLWRDLANAGRLTEIQNRGRLPLPGARVVSAKGLADGSERLIEHFIAPKALQLYRELKRLPLTQPLGQLADVGIGYVTGANDFFHLNVATARQWCIPEIFLQPVVCRGRDLSGLRFTGDDWRLILKMGGSGYLLYIKQKVSLPESVRHYLEHGEKRGVPKAYKCRTRTPWFRVPHVYTPDAFLSYMSGVTPRLVANHAGVVAPNSLHILRLHPQATLTRDAIAALWQTSLTRLSVEIEGHALGGGMLKLEPTEAERVLVALPSDHNGALVELAGELDVLVRRGDQAAAQARADADILKKGIGLSRNDCLLLQNAGEALQRRRYFRGRTT